MASQTTSESGLSVSILRPSISLFFTVDLYLWYPGVSNVHKSDIEYCVSKLVEHPGLRVGIVGKREVNDRKNVKGRVRHSCWLRSSYSVLVYTCRVSSSKLVRHTGSVPERRDRRRDLPVVLEREFRITSTQSTQRVHARDRNILFRTIDTRILNNEIKYFYCWSFPRSDLSRYVKRISPPCLHICARIVCSVHFGGTT